MLHSQLELNFTMIKCRFSNKCTTGLPPYTTTLYTMRCRTIPPTHQSKILRYASSFSHATECDRAQVWCCGFDFPSSIWLICAWFQAWILQHCRWPYLKIKLYEGLPSTPLFSRDKCPLKIHTITLSAVYQTKSTKKGVKRGLFTLRVELLTVCVDFALLQKFVEYHKRQCMKNPWLSTCFTKHRNCKGCSFPRAAGRFNGKHEKNLTSKKFDHLFTYPQELFLFCLTIIVSRSP